MAGMENSSTNLATDFNSDGTYPCPVCRLGQIKALSLMDAMACDLCRNVFTVSLEKQRLFMVSRQPSLIWHWNGRTWVGVHVEGMELGWGYLLIAGAFVLLPPTVFGLSAYFLLETPDTSKSWLPAVWTGLTFLSHLGIIGYAVVGYYQFSIGTYLRVMVNKYALQPK
jgi:hypothetical protein